MIKDAYGNTRFYGIYRGIVVSVEDPELKGRVTLKVPQVLANQTTGWAWRVKHAETLPITPKIGEGVWVMFEGGDPSYPIWVGEFNGASPSSSLSTDTSSLQNLIDLKANKSGDTFTGSININEGKDLVFKASQSSPADAGDLIWFNNAGYEMYRIWMGTNGTNTAPNFRYSPDGVNFTTVELMTTAGGTFTGAVAGTKFTATTPSNPSAVDSDGGVTIKAPASGVKTSSYLQFVNNAYTSQWGGISASSTGMTYDTTATDGHVFNQKITAYGTTGVGSHVILSGSTSNHLVMHPGGNNRSAILRNDAVGFYVLLSDAATTPAIGTGGGAGSWNALRPLTVTLSTGAVSMGHGLSVTGNVTTTGNITSGGTVNYGYTLIDIAYITSSNSAYTVPTGTSKARIRAVGGGGGGGGAVNGAVGYSGGGGAGGYAEWFGTLAAGSTLNITIGGGGGGGSGSGAGSNGGTTSVVYSVGSFTLVSCVGGTAGGSVGSTATGAGGVGGTATTLNGIAITGGFGGGGTAGQGKGTGGASMLSGGVTDPGTSNSGAGGSLYGGGGTGAASNSSTARGGGSGAAGIVIIEFFG